MVHTVNKNPTNSAPDESSDNEWTIIPVKPKLLVSFPRHPAQPTLHMLLLHSYFPMSISKWIWNCYLDGEDLSPNPRGRERSRRIQTAFTKSGTFFAERGIVLHSLNVSTSRIVELFFGSQEDLWKADALVQEYSQAMTGVGNRIRRKENVGKMVCHGIRFLEQFADEFAGRWNLKEERLRELEDMNPVFDSYGKRVLYRIRYVHYMSSQSSSSHLWKYGATWSVTFSDFRVAECFIDGYAEFNFFMNPCVRGLGWYQENPPRSLPNPEENWKGSLSPNDSASVPGVAIPFNTATAATISGAGDPTEKKLEALVIAGSTELGADILNVKSKNSADIELTSSEPREPGLLTLTTAATMTSTSETSNPVEINNKVYWRKEHRRATPKSQISGDRDSEFPQLPLPLCAPPLPPPQLLPPPLINEPTSTKISSSTYSDTLKEFPLLKSQTRKADNLPVKPPSPPPQNVKYQYPINRKRSAGKAMQQLEMKEFTSCNSSNNNHTSATPMDKLIGQTNTKQPNHHNQQNTGHDNSASDNTTSIIGGYGPKCTATANDTAKFGTDSVPSKEALDKFKPKRAAARKRKLEKKRAEAASIGGVTGSSRGGGT